MSKEEITEIEKKVLEVLFGSTRTHGEYCIGFDYIEGDTNLSRKEVKKVVHSLRDKGFAEFYRGLLDDDGQVAGSGYCISVKGVELAEKLEI